MQHGQIVKIVDLHNQPVQGIWFAEIVKPKSGSYTIRYLHPFDDITEDVPANLIFPLQQRIPKHISVWDQLIPPQLFINPHNNCNLILFYYREGYAIVNDTIQLHRYCPEAQVPIQIDMVDDAIWNALQTPIGLNNLGNTCFLNTAILALFYNPVIRQIVFNTPSKINDVIAYIFYTYFRHITTNKKSCKLNITKQMYRSLKIKSGEQDDPENIIQRLLGNNDVLQEMFKITLKTRSKTIYNGSQCMSPNGSGDPGLGDGRRLLPNATNNTIYEIILHHTSNDLQADIITNIQQIEIFAKGDINQDEAVITKMPAEAIQEAKQVLDINNIDDVNTVARAGIIQRLSKSDQGYSKGYRYIVYKVLQVQKSSIAETGQMLHVVFARKKQGPLIELPDVITIANKNYALYCVTLKHGGAKGGHWTTIIRPWRLLPNQIEWYPYWIHFDDDQVHVVKNINTEKWQQRATSLFFVQI